ncbi:MAG TPA: bacillithiol transferase BstA [Terriglobia bacterium]|nr:bacillithiol transferase BstA [Terriglobia bacterium]
MEAAAKDLRYPIGRRQFEGPATFAQREHWITEIEEAPARLGAAVSGLSEAQLDTPYREGGWTVRQVVHHLADSHMNAYIRTRLALTENDPAIKTYNQERWAELADARTAPIDLSLNLFQGLHARWVLLLRSLGADDFARAVMHPERGRMTLDQSLALYAWHGRHHVAHITSLRERMGWK